MVCGQAIATGTLYITLGTILARTYTIMGTGTNVNDTGLIAAFEFELDVFKLNERFAGIFCRDIRWSLYLYGVVPFLLILLTLERTLSFDCRHQALSSDGLC